MPLRPRLLIVGLDGASHNLMSELMSAGILPTFAAFAREAMCAPLRCTWPPHTATGWPSLLTGRLPGEHGIFQFWDCQDDNYGLHATQRESVGCRSIWDVLAGEGWILGLINIPMSHPPGPWPGYQITWPLVPTLHYSQPPELLREISSAGGLSLPDIACMYTGQPDYPERAKEYIRARTKTVRHLMTSRDADAVMVVYPEIDRVSHHYWPEDGEEAGAEGVQRRNVIAEIYSDLDAAFAELLEMVGDECIVMVISDHGFGPGRKGLRIHGALSVEGFCEVDDLQSPESVEDKTHIDAQTVAEYLRGMRWDDTDVYMPAPGSFGLNLNLAGRQAKGKVAARDADKIVRDVTQFLYEIRDPETGESVIEAVIPSDRAYSGPFSHAAPDLLLVPRDPSLMLLSDLYGPLWSDARQSGLHRIEGVCMIRSDGRSAGLKQPIAIEAVAGYLLETLALPSGDIPLVDWTQSADVALRAAGLPSDAWSVRRDKAPPKRLDAHFGDALQDQGQGSFDNAPEAAPTSDEEILSRLRAMGYL